MVRVKSSFERAQRNLLAAIAVGAAVAAALGALVASLSPDIHRVEGALLGSLIGAGLGAVVGELLRGRVLSRVIEPLASERSFVGAHAPDDLGDALFPRPAPRPSIF